MPASDKQLAGNQYLTIFNFEGIILKKSGRFYNETRGKKLIIEGEKQTKLPGEGILEITLCNVRAGATDIPGVADMGVTRMIGFCAGRIWPDGS